MNIIIGLISVIMTFTLTILIEKIYKKEGLYTWISIATIIANILVCKSITLGRFITNLGNVLFASSFLATDIISEKYSEKDSKKAINLAVFSQIVFLIMTQIALLYEPNNIDIAHNSMKTLFSINIRVSLSSIFMYWISNQANVYLYNKLKKRKENKMWLRNNVSTILCNCLENFFFTFLAFIGIYQVTEILEIALVASLIEFIISLLDTPFLYLSVILDKKRRKNEKMYINRWRRHRKRKYNV